MRRLAAVAVAVVGLLRGQGSGPAADYIYPSGVEAPINTKILVRAVCCGTVQPDTVALKAGAQAIVGRTEYAAPSISASWLVFTPAQPLTPRTTYTVTVSVIGRAASTATFTTGSGPDSTPPTVVSTFPANGQDAGYPGLNVSLRFSKPLNPLSLANATPALVELATGVGPYYTSWVLSDAVTLTTQLSDPLQFGQVYRVYFPGRLPQDLSGNTLAAPLPDFKFTTYPEAPKDGPHLRRSLPAEGETATPTNSAIYLEFDRPVFVPSDGGLSLSSDGDPRVTLKVESIAIAGFNVLIVRPQTLLRGNQEYTLSAEKLDDQYGGRLSGATLLRFRTGTLPETRPFQVVSAPAGTVPNVPRLQWRFNRPLNPYVLPRLGRVVNVISGSIPLSDMRLLADGVTLEGDVPGPGDYLLADPVYDRVESKASSNVGSSTIQVSAVRDNRPPSAVAIFPSHRTAAATPSVSPIVLFDEVVQAFAADDVVLWRDDARIAVDVTLSFGTLTIKPRQPLAAAEYRVQVRAPRDLAGNVGESLEWTFRVEPPASNEPFRVVGTEPADRSLNVDSRAPLVINFNRPPNPISILANSRVFAGVNASFVNGRWRFEDNLAIFEPDPAFPPSSRILWTMTSATDFAGVRAEGVLSGGFWVAAATAAPDAFRVTAISPSAGEPGSSIALDFNQSADPSTVSNQTIVLLDEGQYRDIEVVYDVTRRRATISLRNIDLRGGRFLLIAGPGLRSQLGAGIEPFSANVQLVPRTSSYGYGGPRTLGFSILSTVPAAHNAMAVDAPLVVFFSQPMQRDLVERGLRVAVGTANVNGRIEWTPDSSALTFYPSAPLPAGAKGAILLSLVPWGVSGVTTILFNTAPKLPDPPSTRWSLIGAPVYFPTDGIVDVEFDRDRPPGYIQSAVARSGSPPNPTEIPLEVRALSSRVFRFRSTSPIVGQIVAKTQDGEISAPYFISTAPYATPVSRQIAVGPTEAMGDTPVNAFIWLQSKTPLNPISLKARLTVDGAPAPFTIEFAESGFLVLLRPAGLLRGQTKYTVAITGIEDIAGRALPDRSWTFRTGAGPDLTPAHIVSWTPKGIVPASSILRVTFDKPVLFRRQGVQDYKVEPADFTVVTQTATISGAITFSADGRTLSYTPDRPWPLDTAITVAIDRFRYFGWTGAEIGEIRGIGNNLVNPGFTTSSNAAVGLPKLEAINPFRDAPDAPINVQIQARFAEAVMEGSLTRVRLENNGTTVPTRVVLAADSRTVTLLPEPVLSPNQTYTVVVESVRNGEGAAQEEAERWDFHTTASLLTGSTRVVAVVARPRFAVRVDLPRPVNPLSVDAAALDFRVRSVRVAVRVSVDADGRSIQITPVEQPPAGSSYSLGVDSLRDWAGNPMTVYGTLKDEAVDTAPPRVQSLLPTPGSTLNWNNAAALVMDEPFSLRYGNEGVRIRLAGVVIPARVQSAASGLALSLRPITDWIPGETYEVEVRGLIDASGNEASPVSWSFRIVPDASADTTTLRLVSSTPAQGAVGVPPNTPVVFEYSKPVLPGDTFGYPAIFSQREILWNLSYLVRPVFQANRVQLTDGPVPAGSNLQAYLSVRDLAGSALNSTVFFSTAAVPDATPPTLESISPPAGTRLFAGTNDFVLRFSEPVSATGQVAIFSAAGQGVNPRESRYPAQGDGRTILLSFDLPPNAVGTLALLSGISDLSGNTLVATSLAYSTGPFEDFTFLQVLSPKTGFNPPIPVDAGIELRFNQAVNASSLLAGLRVWNDGALIAVTVAPDAEGKVWWITPPSPWRENSTVVVEVASTVFGVSGALLLGAYSATFSVSGTAVNNSGANTLAAIEVSSNAIDLRFAEPRDYPPDEPFGLRLRQQRIPARVERMGEAWFRLTPDSPLDPAQPYYLMAGPGVEIPLRFAGEVESKLEGLDSIATARQDKMGLIHLNLHGKMQHRFQIDHETLAVLDESGRVIPHQATLSSDGLAILIKPYGPAAHYQVILKGKHIRVAVDRPTVE